MIAQSLLVTCVLMLVLSFYLLDVCRFLIPYRTLLIHAYGPVIAGFLAVMFVNIWAGVYHVCRVVGLKDTGRKLRHLEKQVRRHDLLGGDLQDRLED